MDVKQIYECAELILKDFNDLKIPDIQLAFNRAKSGRYGSIYDRIDCSVLMGFISEYDLERQAEISQVRETENGQMKEISKLPIPRLEEIKMKDRPYHEATQPERNDMSVLFQRFYRRFDFIHKFWPLDTPGIRMIMIDKKPMDGLKYVEWKVEQRKKVLNYLKLKK